MSFGGPVPLISKELGNLRFLASYKRNRTMLLVPLSTDDYSDYDVSLKLTSDLGTGMKLMVEGHYGDQAEQQQVLLAHLEFFCQIWT